MEKYNVYIDNDNKFGKLFYLNNYRFCRDNTYINSNLNDYLQLVLSDESYFYKIKDLKEEFNHNNYMYLLESIINSIIEIYNLTYNNYKECNFDEAIADVLNNIKARHDKLLYLYNIELENNIKDFSYYKKNNYIKNKKLV